VTGDALPEPEPLTIAIRAFAEPPAKAPQWTGASRRKRPVTPPSPWVVVFDCESTTDHGQGLRFGAFQVRCDGKLRRSGLFYDPEGLGEEELAVLAAHAKAHELELVTREAFVEGVFYGVGYELRAMIVGLNLGFDIARIAIGHASARGEMRGGFSLKLSADKRRPPVQIKHISQRTSLIRFAAPYRSRKARSERKRGDEVPVRRGHFVDIRTLAGAMFSRSFTLAGLGEFLKVPHPKLDTDEHGGPLTDDYVGYAVRDVQTTWECFEELVCRYGAFGLTGTSPPQVYSEASIGKGYLNAMGLKPWRELQPDFPPQLLGVIMGTYYGGRSEVRIRRELCEVVLTDFLSMYPTVCTLMRLWRFVIAQGLSWRDATAETRTSLERIALADLQRQETWRGLHVLVQVEPAADVFPVRAPYGEDDQATIGANYASSERPLWFTLADCVASKLQTGRAPKVLQAIRLEPLAPQPDLKPVRIAGKADYEVNPLRDDLYKRLIELRQAVKRQRDQTPRGPERDALDAEQNALKIAANATSYGAFVEINVKERADPRKARVYSAAAEPFEVETLADEEPGRFFCPLLATLITGAARLMLASLERLVTDEGLGWAFTDTDSMAIAHPEGLSREEFHARVGRVVEWFGLLNPYDFQGSILKVEDVNVSLDGSGQGEPLFCWAVSAKRYALFNVGADGKPVLRKASAHGLGHLRAAYDATNPAPTIPAPKVRLSELGVELWQHDLWWTIASAALMGRPDHVDLGYHPALGQPAVSRYGASTPRLLAWFMAMNRNLPYRKKVKPFGFLLSLFADPLAEDADFPAGLLPQGRRRLPRPIAPFDRDHAQAIKLAFDRETGLPVKPDALATYRQLLALYPLHPESKFANGDYVDRGVTRRRHIRFAGVRHIGKEANRWEEQHFTGLDDEAVPDYGLTPQDIEGRRDTVREAQARFGLRALAKKSGMASKSVADAIKVAANGAAGVIERLNRAACKLDAEAREREANHCELLAWAREEIAMGGRNEFARQVGVDARNLAKVLAGKRPASAEVIARLRAGRDRQS
jgi:hypothetical protein